MLARLLAARRLARAVREHQHGLRLHRRLVVVARREERDERRHRARRRELEATLWVRGDRAEGGARALRQARRGINELGLGRRLGSRLLALGGRRRWRFCGREELHEDGHRAVLEQRVGEECVQRARAVATPSAGTAASPERRPTSAGSSASESSGDRAVGVGVELLLELFELLRLLSDVLGGESRREQLDGSHLRNFSASDRRRQLR